MKPLLCLIFALCVSVSAQTYTATDILGGTNNVGATATNTYGTVINLTRRDLAGLQFSFKCAGTNEVTGGVATMVFTRSVDGVTYDAVNTLRFSLSANSTNTACLVTNIAVNAIGYLKLNTVENTTTNAITNLSVIYSVK